jgi:hypothetical protein
MGKPGDQIDVDLIDAGRTDPLKLRPTLLLGVKPAHSSGFMVHERLHAEADTVHPLPQKLVERFIGDLTRRALERNLSIRREVELSAQVLE